MGLTQSPFGIVPVEVAMDARLTLQQMRVLVALYTFRNRNTEMAHPTREEIRERTGMALSKISTATTDLERLGWLTKAGNGGRSQATRYRVHVPETISESVTVTESETVTESALNHSRIGNETVPDSGRGKEQTIHTRTDHKVKRASAPTFEVPDWIPADAWAAFMETRKTKKAKSTAYAIGLIVKSLEAFKADGHDPLAILNASIKAGWSDVYPPKVPASAMTPARRTPAPENFANRTYTGGKL